MDKARLLMLIGAAMAEPPQVEKVIEFKALPKLEPLPEIKIQPTYGANQRRRKISKRQRRNG